MKDSTITVKGPGVASFPITKGLPFGVEAYRSLSLEEISIKAVLKSRQEIDNLKTALIILRETLPGERQCDCDGYYEALSKKIALILKPFIEDDPSLTETVKDIIHLIKTGANSYV